jgi:hypothetical protein
MPRITLSNERPIAFVYCVDCDESIDEKRIADHRKDGHKVEITYKNSGLGCLCGHSGEDHDMQAQGEAPCRKCRCYTFRSNGIFDNTQKNDLSCRYCDHRPSSHGENGGPCSVCDCEGYAKKASNEVPEDEKQGLIESMKEPALKHMLENAVEHGLLSNADMQKLVTRDGFPKASPPIKFLMPGLVEYEYMNDGDGARVLVTKNAIDKMLSDPEKSIVGKPVINLAHRDVSPDDYKNGKADGVVTRAWWDPKEAWFCCEALVWDEDTRKNLLSQAVSCEYTALPPWGPAGTLNQVAYDKEVTDGRFKHLAVVAGPRYEGAKLMNSTGGTKTMKLLQWLKKDGKDVQNAIEVDPAKVIFTGADGSEYSIENAVAALEAQEAKKAKTIGDEDMVIVNGKTYKGSDLKNAIAAKVKNADDDEDEEKKKKKAEADAKNAEKDDDDKDKKEKKDLENAEDDDEEKKKKKDEEAKNALLMNSQHTNGQHGAAINEKCAICNAIAADRLSNAARMRKGELPSPVVPSVNDGLRRGKEMFGKTQAQAEAAAAGK